MTDLDGDVLLDASSARDPATWFARMEELGAENGRTEAIGLHHRAVLLENGPALLVTFDTAQSARLRPRQLPVGMALADECDWSHLCLLSDDAPWFRAPELYAHFDRLVDEGFFEGYDRVLFYGAGAAGYAAAAYSVAAPGARVLLLNPVATMLPALASWDRRHLSARRLDFTSRYGFAPDMVEGAREVMLVTDPAEDAAAMHAALFHAPHVRQMGAWLGGDLEASFTRMGIQNHLIAAAMEGSLTPARFGKLWRKRRDDPAWLRALQVAVAHHPARELMLCRNVVERLNHTRFRRRLAELTGELPGAA